MSLKKLVAGALMGLVAATSVQAADLYDPEDAVGYRQAMYQVLSSQLSVMGGMLQGKIPFDAADIHRRAQIMGQVGSVLGDTYTPATRDVADSNLNERAWTNMEDFQSKGASFGTALGALIEQSANPEFSERDARTAVGAVQRGCRDCHDAYRNR